jgi:hypothetical protein
LDFAKEIKQLAKADEPNGAVVKATIKELLKIYKFSD